MILGFLPLHEAALRLARATDEGCLPPEYMVNLAAEGRIDLYYLVRQGFAAVRFAEGGPGDHRVDGKWVKVVKHDCYDVGEHVRVDPAEARRMRGLRSLPTYSGESRGYPIPRWPMRDGELSDAASVSPPHMGPIKVYREDLFVRGEDVSRIAAEQVSGTPNAEYEALRQQNAELQARIAELEASAWEGFDPESETYPSELDMAMQAWRAATTAADSDLRPKEQIKAWLDKTYPDLKELSDEARDRIAKVCNWDRSGGRRRRRQK